jgi:hypothetical protein
MSTATAHPQISATELHRRQRALVAASLLHCPGAKKPTHRRWA